MNIPYVTIILFSILLLFKICINLIYKNRDIIKKKFCYLDNNNINLKNFYKIYTSLITHNSILYHFIPNLLITAIMGSFLENLIGTYKMYKFIIICIFVFWTFIYLLGIKSKTGCGSSAIFYSFFSYFFTIKASYAIKELNRILLLLLPIIILSVFHIIGRIISSSTEYIHILSLMYGYMAGIYYSQSRRRINYFNLYKN